MRAPITISAAIWQRCQHIANTGNYSQAVENMCAAFKSSEALANWFDCFDQKNEEKVLRQASLAVLHCRLHNTTAQNGKPLRTDPWPAGKINTEFAMHCTGKSKEEVEKLYEEFTKSKK